MSEVIKFLASREKIQFSRDNFFFHLFVCMRKFAQLVMSALLANKLLSK